MYFSFNICANNKAFWSRGVALGSFCPSHQLLPCILCLKIIRYALSEKVYTFSNCLSCTQEWELLVISKLEWKIVAVTSFDYVDHIMEQIKWKRRNDSMLRRHMLTLISFCYIGKYDTTIYFYAQRVCVLNTHTVQISKYHSMFCYVSEWWWCVCVFIEIASFRHRII